MNYPRGSTWRKWDLHVHTPASIIQHYGSHSSEETWEEFISDLEALPDEYKVIGINDYNFIDGYRKVLDYKNQGRLRNIDLVLAVIELRIDKFVGTDDWRRLNLHIIFSEELSPDEIQSQFLNGISSSHVLSPEFSKSVNWDGIHTPASLAELGKAIQNSVPTSERRKFDNHILVGFSNLNCSIEQVFELLGKDRFKDKHITAIGKAEWENMKWTAQSIASKKTFINSVDLVFTAAESIESYYKGQNSLMAQSVNSRLLHSSDAHYLSSETSQSNRIGNSFTWIKANPTFKGLKHAIAEFDDRVYIGKVPPQLDLVNGNPRKFIDHISIEASPDSKITDKWFNNVGTIPLNSGLISVIGNKGSGKSALTDIIGLLGNSRNQRHFSFLDKTRFKNPKDKLASGFQAKLRWSDGHEIARNLNDVVDETEAELVRYIPQKFFETICNDIAKEDNQFELELHQVIFSHIPVTNRLDCVSLKDLIKTKTAEINERVAMLKHDLSGINAQICDIEHQLKPVYKQQLKNELNEKTRELTAHQISKPPKIEFRASEGESEHSRRVDEINNEINRLTEEEIQLQTRLKKVSDLVGKFDRARSQIDLVRTRIEGDKTKFDNLDLPIYFKDIVSVSIDTSKLDALAVEAEEEKLKIETELDVLPASRNAMEVERAELVEKLNQPQKEFQEYEKRLSDWKVKEAEIIGDAGKLNSLRYYENLIDSLNHLPIQLKILKEKRLKTALEIHKQITELSKVYKKLYAPVQRFIEEDELAKRFEMQFDVSVIQRDFTEKLLMNVRQNISGKFFQGKAKSDLEEIVEKHDFNETVAVEAFLNEIDIFLVDENLEDLSKSNVPEFYDFIFSLGYLKPTYQLKLFGKGIEQLSPGERGHLLLVFYLLIDKDDRPLIIDQPEGNLDGQSIYETLVLAIKRAKKTRQILIVTHNPNLAVVCDSEQFIHAEISRKNGNAVEYTTGALEETYLKRAVIDKLEGTHPAFENRRSKYSFGIES